MGAISPIQTPMTGGGPIAQPAPPVSAPTTPPPANPVTAGGPPPDMAALVAALTNLVTILQQLVTQLQAAGGVAAAQAGAAGVQPPGTPAPAPIPAPALTTAPVAPAPAPAPAVVPAPAPAPAPVPAPAPAPVYNGAYAVALLKSEIAAPTSNATAADKQMMTMALGVMEPKAHLLLPQEVQQLANIFASARGGAFPQAQLMAWGQAASSRVGVA